MTFFVAPGSVVFHRYRDCIGLNQARAIRVVDETQAPAAPCRLCGPERPVTPEPSILIASLPERRLACARF